MSEQLTLPAEARDGAGKGASRALRREGRVPAVVYGEKKEPLAIHVEEKKTVLMVEHHMDVVTGLAQRIAVMHHGALLACDTPAAVMANETVQSAYLGEAL